MPLLYNCQCGHALGVERLLRAGSDPNGGACIEPDCPALVGQYSLVGGASTPLIQACKTGHENCVAAIAGIRADLEAVNWLRRTALTEASYYGQFEIATLLLRNGAIVNGCPAGTGGSPLYWAARHGHAPMTQLLLDWDARVEGNDQDKDALTVAIEYDKPATVKLLLAYGARRDLLPRPFDEEETEDDDEDLQASRAEWRATYAATAHPGEQFAHYCESPQTHTLLRETRGYTPLHFLEVLTTARTRRLLEAGANPHKPAATEGWPCPWPTPLDLARHQERENNAPPDSPAAVLLGWWRSRVLAFAMGSHERLGQESDVRHLTQELMELIVTKLERLEVHAASEAPG